MRRLVSEESVPTGSLPRVTNVENFPGIPSTLFFTAIEGLREFQIFQLHVFQEHSARKTAEMVGVSVARVYVAKLRAGRAFKQEYSKLKEAAS